MMIYKRCPRCGKRIPEGMRCESCEKERRRTGNRTDGVRTEYRTRRWERERLVCLQRFCYMDLYMLYRYGQVVNADRVHHIVEALEDPKRFHDAGNHFPTSDWAHHEIHRRYKVEDKKSVQDELRGYMKRWMDENGF